MSFHGTDIQDVAYGVLLQPAERKERDADDMSGTVRSETKKMAAN